MFMSFSKNKFTLLWQISVTDVSVGFRPRHVGAHPGEHQHDVSIQISMKTTCYLEIYIIMKHARIQSNLFKLKHLLNISHH